MARGRRSDDDEGATVAADPRQAAGVILAGGRSSRMGKPKAGLDWHGSTLLHRTAAVLTRSVGGPVVVVRAPGQPLPDLPPAIRVVEDPIEGLGPLQGLAAGLAAVVTEHDEAFVCSTDLPFLHPAFVRRVLAELGATGADVALPVARGYRQPLAAGYRTALADLVADLLATGPARPGRLFERCRVDALFEPDLLADPKVARLDPALESLVNVNTPEAYAAARARPEPEISCERYGVRAGAGTENARPVRAATLARCAERVGVALGDHLIVALNGERVPPDPLLPLVRGDAVTFVATEVAG